MDGGAFQRPLMARPLFPGLNDSEMNAYWKLARPWAIDQAGYVMLRLPLERVAWISSVNGYWPLP